MRIYAALLLLLLAASLSFAQGERSVFVGDSTNMADCNFWCCVPSYAYCSGAHQCRASQNATWMGMCGQGDYAEWTTSSLDADNYTINVTAGCVAYGSCASEQCELSLSINGRQVATLPFEDTNTDDREFTYSNYTFNTRLSGINKMKLSFANDCFGGTGGDRGGAIYGINIALNESLEGTATPEATATPTPTPGSSVTPTPEASPTPIPLQPVSCYGISAVLAMLLVCGAFLRSRN